MNPRIAEGYLPCYRAGMRADSRIVKAARVAEQDGALREKLQEQAAFDAQVCAAIHSLQPPEKLRQRLDARRGGETPRLRKNFAHPAILCAIAGVLLIVGFLVYVGVDRLRDFPGKDQAERMVETLSRMSGLEFEPARGQAGGLEDWFYMRGFEGFALPADLAKLPVAGSRVFKLNGHPVSQIAIEEHATILHVFRASDFGVRLTENGGWTTFEQEGWAAAIRQRDDLCTLLAFRGDAAEMDRFIRTLRP